MPEPRGILVNVAELADIWGVSERDVRTWVRARCPVFDLDAAGEPIFDTAAVDAWRRWWRVRLARRSNRGTSVRQATAERMAKRIRELRRRALGREPGAPA